MNKKQTKQTPPVVRIFQGLINAGLVIWAARDIRQRDASQLNGNRKFWLVATFAPPFGPIAYFIFGRKRAAQTTEVQPVTISQS